LFGSGDADAGKMLCLGMETAPLALEEAETAAPSIRRTVCRRCFVVLDAEDNYCRRCGTPTERVQAAWSAAGPVATVPAAPPSAGGKFLESRATVLVMLFTVLGPLALPLLWRSSRFSPAWKIGLTLLMLFGTAAIVWLFGYVIHMTLKPLEDLQKLQSMS
jgi:hypothetical protein